MPTTETIRGNWNEISRQCGLEQECLSRTLEYLQKTGRKQSHVDLVEEYYRASDLFGPGASQGVSYSSAVHLDLSSVVPCMAGPKRPQDRVPLSDIKQSFRSSLTHPAGHSGFGLSSDALAPQVVEVEQRSVTVQHGQLAIAAITSCTNTSNPSVLLAAGLLAKKAVQRGLRTPGHVKTSLAPGSRVVTRYLEAAGLSAPLEELGFHTVGYGCTTCMGNSGDVEPEMQAAADKGIITAAVLSGNRNFEGRVHLSVKANYLASPPLVVAAALAGRVDIDFASEALGLDPDGSEVFLSDIWPTPEEVASAVFEFVRPEFFQSEYSREASSSWSALDSAGGSVTYPWDSKNTFIAPPPLLERPTGPVRDAYCLMLLGDSVTTDHISPNSAIRDGPAFEFLRAAGVEKKVVSREPAAVDDDSTEALRARARSKPFGSLT
ncbi:acoA [Symbiodinium natans]|uniref:AcoA protein n=1 Tax=Symbiodinium natans TaxID=878477 RepID=A0A812QJH8_9DINO|nr:acoA [Symbiodinium natans]